jgi:hypothetical protein
VCGRTFLVGEQVHSFVSIEGRHEVCELCARTTAELGWLPADQDGAEEKLRAEHERKPGFLKRMFARPPRAEEEEPAPVAIHELDTERYDVEAEWEEERPSRERPKVPVPQVDATPARLPDTDPTPARPDTDPIPARPDADPTPARLPDADATPAPLPDPAGRGMRPRRLQPDLSPSTRFERAITRFNASEAGRTVAGLTRTLGAPSASVGDLAGADDVVRVTVAWELTWYQWGVDLSDELRPVFELSKGFEVDEIDAAARQWNASAHDGRIVMVAPRRREAVDGKPVHR